MTFLLTLDLAQYGRIVLGLVIGGAAAAPLAGYHVQVLPQRVTMVLAGLVVLALSAVNFHAARLRHSSGGLLVTERGFRAGSTRAFSGQPIWGQVA